MQLYALIRNKPVVVNIPANPSRIVVTDGFHITSPVEISFSQKRTYYLKVVCAIEDDQLVVGLVIMFLLFAMGTTSGMLLLQLLSLAPVVYILFRYYIARKNFIRIKPA
jgi:hypothetical protein